MEIKVKIGGTKMTVEAVDNYVFKIGDKLLRINKDMVDKYSKTICPVDDEYMKYMSDVFGDDGCKDSVLSYRIELDMEKELCGYER